MTFDNQSRAEMYLNDPEFSGDLGDLMAVTLSNVSQISIVIFTNNPSLPVFALLQSQP